MATRVGEEKAENWGRTRGRGREKTVAKEAKRQSLEKDSKRVEERVCFGPPVVLVGLHGPIRAQESRAVCVRQV